MTGKRDIREPYVRYNIGFLFLCATVVSQAAFAEITYLNCGSLMLSLDSSSNSATMRLDTVKMDDIELITTDELYSLSKPLGDGTFELVISRYTAKYALTFGPKGDVTTEKGECFITAKPERKF